MSIIGSLQVSAKELMLMIVFLMTAVMIFASVIHYAEKETFTSIPIGKRRQLHFIHTSPARKPQSMFQPLNPHYLSLVPWVWITR